MSEGGWESLIAIYREAAAERRAAQQVPPVACPNDGEPLVTGPGGEPFCRFDGWPKF